MPFRFFSEALAEATRRRLSFNSQPLHGRGRARLLLVLVKIAQCLSQISCPFYQSDHLTLVFRKRDNASRGKTMIDELVR